MNFPTTLQAVNSKLISDYLANFSTADIRSNSVPGVRPIPNFDYYLIGEKKWIHVSYCIL